MAGHEWEDWFEREEFIGQISDIRVQNLQVERELVQKRTFTRWMNLHLEKCDPPMEVQDLFRDIQDGRILMALLEELSGCKLLHGFKKSSHRIFRLNNIAKVLTFLEERNVKLVSIDASDVADGNSSIILGLIWNIILFFQIKELTGNIRSQFPSSSSLSSILTSSDSDTSYSSTPSEERRPSTVAMRDHGKAIKKLLQWVQKRTRKYGVAVQDFGKSWTSGLAFLAVIKSIDPTLVDMRRALLRTARENLEDAFRTAHYSLGIPRLLEPEDVSINSPDDQSIMTYVSQFLEHFPGIEEPEEPSQVIERSVSMGRLSSRNSDSDLLRNGVHRSRLKERPYTVRKDWVQPPPKIFISSVSEDRGLMSPTSPPAGSRSWASEDSLAGPTPVEDRSTSVAGDPKDPGKEGFTISNSNSPQLSYADSPIGSSVIESVNTESVISDSAIGSPDSWVESEVEVMPERLGESQSDSSLCDSGTAWDVNVPPATPEEVTTLDEGLMPSIVDRPPDEQSGSELFIDEGIYSLSSLESTQERIQAQSEKEEDKKKQEVEKEASLLDLNQDWASKHVPSQSETENKAEGDYKQMDKSLLQKDQISSEQQPSLTLSDATEQTNSGVVHSLEPNETNQSQLMEQDSVEANTHRESECAKEAVDFRGDLQDHEGQLNVDTKRASGRNSSEEIEGETVCQRKDTSSEEGREETGILKKRGEEAIENSKTQDKASQGVLNGHSDPQENTSTQIHDAIANTHPTNQGITTKPSLDLSMDLNIPQISISSDSTEKDKERTCGPEREGQAGDEDLGLTGSSGSQGFDSPENLGDLLSEKVQPVPSEQTRDRENGHLDDMNQHDIMKSSNAISSESEEISKTGATTDKTEMDSVAQPPSTDAETHPVHSDQDIERNSTDQLNGHQDKQGTSSPVDETAIAQENRSDLINSWSNGERGPICYRPGSEARDVDLFYRDIDRSSPLEDLVGDRIDPMDLFYPDKEEPMFTEPPDREIESQSSVLSVSALQPAPASETLPETPPPSQLGEDFMDGMDFAVQEQDKEITETHQGIDTPSEPQEQHLLPGEKLVGGRGTDGPAEGSDLSETQDQSPGSARENMEPMRSEAKSSRRQDEILIPTALRHRKMASSTESMDNQTTVSTSKAPGDDSDLGRREGSELYLLLLLWLLLYCLWLLPQMDVTALPSLLLNLDH
ncbi:calmin [Centroberyx affinis]|uniref:calmin n=1 Tax=Centroberyx affinis TaxID=166261 RepID=UPI003A5BDB06